MATNFKSIHIVAGTNEILNRNIKQHTIDKYAKRMIETAKKYSEDVIIGSIPYTEYNQNDEDIQRTNRTLAHICEELNCQFADVNNGFDTKSMA